MPSESERIMGWFDEANLLVDSMARSYRDDRCEERHCDFCGGRYRGPAVYCSLTCAMEDE